MKKSTLLFALLASCLAATLPAYAQTGPIKIVVPFAAGGATDAVARVLAPHLSKELGRSVVIDNRPGASGQLGTAYVKTAPPDGSTYLFALDHSVVIVPLQMASANYDALRDFVPVGQVAQFQWTFATPITDKATNLKEFLENARQHPAQANYGVPLQGGVPSLIGDELFRQSGVRLEQVPFGGSAQLMPQLVGGHLASGVTGEPEGFEMLKGGKIRILAVSGSQRSSNLPDVPTFEELGFTGLNINSFNAFFAPKGLPEELAKEFNAALAVALQNDVVRQRIADMTMVVAPTNLEEAQKSLKTSYDFWHRPGVVKPLNGS